jgi:hypothetical protein
MRAGPNLRQQAHTQLTNALQAEKDAAQVSAVPFWDEVAGHTADSLQALRAAQTSIAQAKTQRQLTPGAAAEAQAAIAKAIGLDERVQGIAQSQGDKKLAGDLLAQAITYKLAARKAVDDGAPEYAGTVPCVVKKRFTVHAVPAGYESSYADVFPHVPKGAIDVSVSFVVAGTSKPAPRTIFGAQTWTSKVVGFRANGTLAVHVDVTGPGVGKPDEKFVEWEVVVRFRAKECPPGRR